MARPDWLRLPRGPLAALGMTGVLLGGTACSGEPPSLTDGANPGNPRPSPSWSPAAVALQPPPATGMDVYALTGGIPAESAPSFLRPMPMPPELAAYRGAVLTDGTPLARRTVAVLASLPPEWRAYVDAAAQLGVTFRVAADRYAEELVPEADLPGGQRYSGLYERSFLVVAVGHAPSEDPPQYVALDMEQTFRHELLHLLNDLAVADANGVAQVSDLPAMRALLEDMPAAVLDAVAQAHRHDDGSPPEPSELRSELVAYGGSAWLAFAGADREERVLRSGTALLFQTVDPPTDLTDSELNTVLQAGELMEIYMQTWAAGLRSALADAAARQPVTATSVRPYAGTAVRFAEAGTPGGMRTTSR